MPNLIVTVGAVLDRSVDTVFKSVGTAARNAEKKSAQGAKNTTRAVRQELGKQQDAHVKTHQAMLAYREKTMLRTSRMTGRAAANEVAAQGRAAAAMRRQREGARAQSARVVQKLTEQEAAAERKAAGALATWKRGVVRSSAIYAGKLAAKEVKDKQAKEAGLAAYRESVMRKSALMTGALAAKAAKDDAKAENDKKAYRERLRRNTALWSGRQAAKEARAERLEREKEDRKRDRAVAKSQRADNRMGDWGIQHAERGVMTGLGLGAAGATAAVAYTASVMRDLGRGLGLDTDLGSAVSRNVDLETQATNLSNQGYMPGDPRNGRRVGARELVDESREVGRKTGFAASQVLSGVEAFTTKTGDLATARDIVGQLSILSRATGTNLEHMVAAAGDLEPQLRNVPDKAAKIVELMRVFAGQGKLGAVEIRNLATQMPKLAAAASKFEGGPINNLVAMGALAQITKTYGGATSPVEAATSVASFSNNFGKNARYEAMKALGVDVNSETERGKYDNFLETILLALKKTNTPQELNKIFMDKGSRQTTLGIATLYNRAMDATPGDKATKQAAGEAAVREEFTRFERANMSQAEVADSFKESMSTAAVKVQDFNSRMEEFAKTLLDRVQDPLFKLGDQFIEMLPALTVLVPALTEFATDILKLTNMLFGSGDATKDAEAKLKQDSAERTLMRAREHAAQGRLTPEDMAALGAANETAKREVERRRGAAKTAGDTTFWDVVGEGAGIATDNAFGGSALEAKEGRKNIATAELSQAQVLADRLDKGFRDLTAVLTSGKARMKVDGSAANPQAPGGDLKHPTTARTGAAASRR